MILIADDNSEVRRMIRDLIEDIDPACIECEDGGAAIEAYAQHQPDFVLMDVQMTPVDGLAATKQILSHYPGAKIIAVTQHNDATTREAAMSAGAWAFVSKDDLMLLRTLLRTGERPVGNS